MPSGQLVTSLGTGQPQGGVGERQSLCSPPGLQAVRPVLLCTCVISSRNTVVSIPQMPFELCYSSHRESSGEEEGAV